MLFLLPIGNNSSHYEYTVDSDTLLKTAVRKEIEALHDTQDPEPDASIEYLFVLSASNSYSKSEFVNCTDLNDDYNRMRLAIETAKKIAKLKVPEEVKKLNLDISETLKRYGPTIIYNGDKWQNNDLKKALKISLKDYPESNFVFLDLSEDEINTKGQFLSLKKDLPLQNTSVGIVTHAYHFPRVSRMLSEEAPLYPFVEKVKKCVFLVDRTFTSPGIQDKIEGEVSKIPEYIRKGDLAYKPASDVLWKG